MDNILIASEIDFCIETMKNFEIDQIGSQQWIEWHGRLIKLNQQAILEALEIKEEYVKETLVCRGKIPVIVYETITISVWRTKVLPLIIYYEPYFPNSFTLYSVLYHESVCVALLEIVLFHSNSCETLDDVSLDLLHYCTQAVIQLYNFKHTELSENENVQKEFERQKSNLQFDIGTRSISIIRYFAEYLSSLPITITSAMYDKLDIPMLLVQLICSKPWIREENGNTFKYLNDAKWHKVSGEAITKLTPAEAQVWIGLRQLLLDKCCLTHYEFTEYRKNQLQTLLKYLHETVLDQLSPLIELKQWLCRLSMIKPQPIGKSPILLEVLPLIKTNILSKNENEWKNIAHKHIQLFFKRKHDDLVEMAQSLNKAYSTDILEKLEQIQINICAGCAGKATKKCSRCKNEHYCSRKCQVKHWPQHKETCSATVENK